MKNNQKPTQEEDVEQILERLFAQRNIEAIIALHVHNTKRLLDEKDLITIEPDNLDNLK